MKKPAKRKPKKPRRVVLGVGWLYPQLGFVGGRAVWIHLRGEKPMFDGRSRVTQVKLRVAGTVWRRVRLVAEVLK